VTADHPIPFAAAVSPLELPPQPVSAEFFVLTSVLRVTFDKPIAPSSPDPGNWFVRVDDLAPQVTNASAGQDAVTLTLGTPAMDPGESTVNYSPPPFDVVGTNGLPVQAFSGLVPTVIGP